MRSRCSSASSSEHRQPGGSIWRGWRVKRCRVTSKPCAASHPERLLLDRAMTLAEGIPFLTEELVASGLTASGTVDSTVTDLMLARVGALSTDALTLVRAASLADGHARSTLLNEVTGLDGTRLDEAAHEAVGVSVLDVDDTIDGYRFHHALMREAVDHAILPGERRRWHRRWAEALESSDDARRHGSMVTAAAHHWARTDDHERAFSSALVAADWAADIGAEAERAALLTRLLDLWSSIDDAEQQAGRSRDEVFEEAMWAHDLSGSLTGALELVESELQRPDEGVDAGTRRMQRQLVHRWVLEELGRPEAQPLEATLATLLEQAARAPRTPMFVRLVVELVWATEDRERAEQLWPLLEEAIDVADAQGAALDRWNIAGCRASLLRNRGYQDEAADLYLEKLAWVRAEYPVSRVMAWETNAMFLLTAAGRFREAVEIGLVTIRRLGSPLLARRNWDFVRGTLAEAMIDLGRWEQAEAYLTQTRASQSEGIYLMSFRLLAGLIRARSGDTAEAAALLDATVTELSDPGMQSQAFIDIQVGVLAAELAVQQGDLEGARSRLRELWRHPANQGDSQLWRVLVLAARVETDLASAAGSGISAHGFDQIVAVADDIKGTCAFADVWTAQVTAERLRAEGSDSSVLWQEVADGWAGNGQVHDQAWALVRLAEAALRDGDAPIAQAGLEQAVALGEELGARPVIQAARDVARRGRLTLSALDTVATVDDPAAAVSVESADPARARRAAPRRHRAEQRADRHDPVHLSQDGERSCVAHLGQARRGEPDGGSRGGAPRAAPRDGARGQGLSRRSRQASVSATWLNVKRCSPATLSSGSASTPATPSGGTSPG